MMSSKTLLRLFAVFAIFTSSLADQEAPAEEAGGLDINWDQVFTGISSFVGQSVGAVDCDEQTRANAGCNVAPFSGTFVCREYGTIFGYTWRRTVCAQNIVAGLTLGGATDTCGFCPEEGAAPEICTCPCDEGKVRVTVTSLFGLINTEQCVTNGFSQHATAWGNAIKCVETC